MKGKKNSDRVCSLIDDLKKRENNQIDVFINEIKKKKEGDLGRYIIRERLLKLEPRSNLWVFFALLLISQTGRGLSKSYFLEKLNDIKYAFMRTDPLELFDSYKRRLFNQILTNRKEFDKFILFNKISILLSGFKNVLKNTLC